MTDIHGIRPPVPVGVDPMLLKMAAMAAGGILVLILLFLLVRYWLKKRGRPEPLKALPLPVPPHAEALGALDLLLQKEILDLRLFYFDLTAILRHYIGRSFAINASEMTSQEFIRCIGKIDMDRAIKRDMAQFQTLADPFKYAGIVPEAGRVKEDLAWVRQMIDQTESHLARKKQGEEK